MATEELTAKFEASSEQVDAFNPENQLVHSSEMLDALGNAYIRELKTKAKDSELALNLRVLYVSKMQMVADGKRLCLGMLASVSHQDDEILQERFNHPGNRFPADKCECVSCISSIAMKNS